MHINRKRTAKEIETIDLVIRYIESNRETAINQLFPGATEDYKQEWRDRNPLKVKIGRDKWAKDNKDKLAINSKKWRDKNKEKCIAATRKWQKENPERAKQSNIKWAKENREKVNKYIKKSKIKHKERVKAYQQTPERKFSIRLRMRVVNALKKYTKEGKVKSSDEYGINYEKIIEKLKPFPKDRHRYHLDHIKPLCDFKLINKDGTQNLKEIKRAFSPKNYQWLLIKENLSKGRKISKK